MPVSKKSLAYAPFEARSKADIVAFRAVHSGEATPEQQRRALNVLLEDICRVYDVSFRPEGDRDTCFAEGRRFVGLQVIKLLNAPLPKDLP